MPTPARRALASLVAILAAMLSLGAPALAQCSGWTRADSASGGGPQGDVYALALAPNGDIIAGGGFTRVGNGVVNNIARWNGSVWSPMGSGMNNSVLALAALPSGDVIAGGWFTSAGGVSVSNVARWSGSAWAPMGVGPGFAPYALLAMPNGDVVAGGFGGGVSRWNGTAWTPLGALDGSVYDLAADAAGGIIAVGGFTGGVARWDGAAWTVIGGGVTRQSFPYVNTVIVQTNGAIVVGGGFDRAGGPNGLPVSNIARWTGTAWDALAGGTPNTVNKILYTGGFNLTAYTGGPTMGWNGSAWSTTPSASDVPGVRAAVLGPQSVTVGGLFPLQVGLGFNAVILRSGVAQASNGRWYPLGSGTSNGGASRLLAMPQGGVIVAGSFTGVSGVAANRIAKWDGAFWSPLGDGLSSEPTSLAAMPGGDLLAAGSFALPGTAGPVSVARWNGLAWAAMGAPLPSCSAITVSANGNVAAARGFRPGVLTTEVAVQVGAQWSSLGQGVPLAAVNALAFMPNGDVIAAGFSDPDSIKKYGAFANVGRWDGAQWVQMAGGIGDYSGGQVDALAVMPNGDLIAAGSFETAGGAPARNVARWNGSAWSPMGGGLSGGIFSLVVSPEGELFACGSLADFNHIARWTGSAWVPAFPFEAGTSAAFINSIAFLSPAPGVRRILAGGAFSSTQSTATIGIAQYVAGTGWIVRPPLPASAPVGGRARFNATLSIPFCDFPLQWRLNGAPIGSSGAPTPNGSMFFPNSATGELIALNLSPLDSGAITVATPSGIVSAPARLTVGRSACPGDANADGVVDFFDLALLLAYYGTTAPTPGENGDVNGDGAIDFFDLNILLANYGRAC